METEEVRWKKYVFVFFITATIFTVAFSASSLFDKRRLTEVRTLENRLALSFLALEIESDLLSELSCEDTYVSLTTRDLEALGERLTYLEGQGTDTETIRDLKIQYSLFELKDYLFLKQFKSRCGADLQFVFFFYSNEGDCDDCIRQGRILEKIRAEYPSVRVYSFDYNLDVPGVNSLKRFYDLKRELPLMIINRNIFYGFRNAEGLLEIIHPEMTSEGATLE